MEAGHFGIPEIGHWPVAPMQPHIHPYMHPHLPSHIRTDPLMHSRVHHHTWLVAWTTQACVSTSGFGFGKKEKKTQPFIEISFM